MIGTIYGIFLCICIALAALWTATYIPVGAVAAAIIIGIVVGNTLKPGKRFKPGIRFSEKHILSFAIALMGVKPQFPDSSEAWAQSDFSHHYRANGYVVKLPDSGRIIPFQQKIRASDRYW